MKPLIFIPMIGVISALLPTGCGNRERDRHLPEVASGVSFSAKHGLLVPLVTANFIGLQLADVEERKVAVSVRFTTRIYQASSQRQFASTLPAATASALASAFIGPEQAALLTIGQSAIVTVSDTESLQAKVANVHRTLEKLDGQAEVLLAITDGAARLTNRMTVQVTVPLGREHSIVTIPRSALLRTVEGDFVYTVSGARFVRAAIRTGEVNAHTLEVTDGLYAGDRIVVQPVMTLWLAELQSIRGGKSCADD